MSKPEVFIIESLRFSDECKQRNEGHIISRILGMRGKQCEYFYIRTEKEFAEVLQFFTTSQCRYLHISCHGNNQSMCTTLDNVPFRKLASLLNGHIDHRRLFLSACSMTRIKLAREVMPKTGCLSILGPYNTIKFSDAAVFWPSLYHLMFKIDRHGMKNRTLRKTTQSLAQVYRLRLKYFGRDTEHFDGFKSYEITQRRIRRLN